MPLELQPKLLRALEERRVVPVGETRPVPFDARIVASTNQRLVERVASGAFRADLFARLSELSVEMPPLRERREDVLPLLAHAWGERLPPLDPELVQALLLHPWPLNVRELVKLASELRVAGLEDGRLMLAAFEPHRRRLAALVAGTDAQPGEAPPAAVPPAAVPPAAVAPAAPVAASRAAPAPGREELVALLERFGGVLADVARHTGRSRKQVYRWLAEHGLDAERYRR
jgi:DNA-binding NtrC family response regulator